MVKIVGRNGLDLYGAMSTGNPDTDFVRVGVDSPTVPTVRERTANGSVFRASYLWRGTWDSTTPYIPGDLVFYSNGLYIAKSSNTNKIPPAFTGDWDRMLASGMVNPMTADGDLIVGSASGFPVRLAKGTNNRVFGVDSSGVLGYRQVQTADLYGTPGTGATDSAVTQVQRVLQVPTAGVQDIPYVFPLVPVDVTGAAITLATTANSVLIFFVQAQAYHSVANGRGMFEVFDVTANSIAYLASSPYIGNPTAFVAMGHYIVAPILNPSGGVRTYKLRTYNVDAGTFSIIQYGVLFTVVELKR